MEAEGPGSADCAPKVAPGVPNFKCDMMTQWRGVVVGPRLAYLRTRDLRFGGSSFKRVAGRKPGVRAIREEVSGVKPKLSAVRAKSGSPGPPEA